MKLIQEVNGQKLRGGFYTPAPVVDVCLERVAGLLGRQERTRLLEPSAGDGAFIRGVTRNGARTHLGTCAITAVEPTASEAAHCRAELDQRGLSGEVVVDSFFRWLSHRTTNEYDVVVGNPPFVRYQFVPEDDRFLAEWLLHQRGHDLHGVSNYWIPFVLLSLDLLRVGGVFAMVLPGELLCTMSAGQVRSALITHFEQLRVDVFAKGTFPGILQDVLIISGVRATSAARQRPVRFGEHVAGALCHWEHEIDDSGQSWTRYLLSAAEWDAYVAGCALPGFAPMRQVASMGVAIVTGANDFFTVDDGILRTYGLAPWALPLLARTADSPGLIVTKADHERARRGGRKCWLLDCAASKPDPMAFEGAAHYLELGRAQKLHKRYKCAIREPWYRVPHIQRGALMMAKRAHQHHRLLLNQASLYTTDTIYRGEMKPGYENREADLVAGFHNSLTLLSAELEGRTYGGGVLELVPSEIGRLVVPVVPTGTAMVEFDRLSRRTGGQRDSDDSLIDATDEMLSRAAPEFARLREALMHARNRLRARRLEA